MAARITVWIAETAPNGRDRGKPLHAIFEGRTPEGVARATAHTPKERGLTMKKFLVLYKAPASSFQQMMSATPEQQKAGMDSWMAWGRKAASSIVDMGAPLGKSLRVTPTAAAAVSNDLGGYSILQAESKEALAETLKGHPHFMMPEGSIEVIEIMPMPGQ